MDTASHGPRAFRHADCIDRTHPQRAEVEDFIHAIYATRFNARPPALMPHLLAFRDAEARLLAAVGLRCAVEGPLFVERYLGAPVEGVLARRLGTAPSRAEVVEIGNFAAATPGAARAVILALIPVLRGAGLRWTLFAATRQLRNAFARLGLDPRFLCRAQAEALGAEGDAWGRYYDTDPEVLFGDLAACRASGGRDDCRPREDSSSTIRRPTGALGQESAENWTAQADLQSPQPMSDRLLHSVQLMAMDETVIGAAREGDLAPAIMPACGVQA